MAHRRSSVCRLSRSRAAVFFAEALQTDADRIDFPRQLLEALWNARDQCLDVHAWLERLRDNLLASFAARCRTVGEEMDNLDASRRRGSPIERLFLIGHGGQLVGDGGQKVGQSIFLRSDRLIHGKTLLVSVSLVVARAFSRTLASNLTRTMRTSRNCSNSFSKTLSKPQRIPSSSSSTALVSAICGSSSAAR
jgi:hypothetical protein